MMPTWEQVEPWVIPIVLVFGALVSFGTRAFIKSHIEEQIRHGFAKSMEAVRLELRKTEETFKSSLRVREAEVSALQVAFLSGRTQRYALLDKRRIEAIESIWSAVSELVAMKNLAMMLGMIKLEQLAERSSYDAGVRDFMKSITSIVPEEKPKVGQKITKEQPFVSDLAWAYCAAYIAVCSYYYAYAKVIEIGLKDAHKMMKEDGIKKILKAALPKSAEYIDALEPSAFYALIEPLEKLLLEELKRNLEDASIDEGRTKQARAIMAAVSEEEAQKVAARISTAG